MAHFSPIDDQRAQGISGGISRSFNWQESRSYLINFELNNTSNQGFFNGNTVNVDVTIIKHDQEPGPTAPGLAI